MCHCKSELADFNKAEIGATCLLDRILQILTKKNTEISARWKAIARAKRPLKLWGVSDRQVRDEVLDHGGTWNGKWMV